MARRGAGPPEFRPTEHFPPAAGPGILCPLATGVVNKIRAVRPLKLGSSAAADELDRTET